jgi:hypothetical protein
MYWRVLTLVKFYVTIYFALLDPSRGYCERVRSLETQTLDDTINITL